MKVVLLRVLPAVPVFVVSVAPVAPGLPVAAVVEHAVPAAFSPDPVLYEPAAAVAAVELQRDAAAVGPVDVVALRRVRHAAAVELAAPDVQLALHEPDAQRAAAAGVVVSRPHEAVEAVPQVVVVPRLAAVPLVPPFVQPAVQAHCLDPDPDARLAPGTSVPSRDPTPDSHATSYSSQA